MRRDLEVERTSIDLHVDSHVGGAHAGRAPVRPRRRDSATFHARPVMTASMAVRYSRLPRTSVIGRAAAHIVRRAASRDAVSVAPAASAPVRSTRMKGVGPTAPNANRASPSDVIRPHRLIVARSTPRRLVMRPNDAPASVAGNGRAMDATSSPRDKTVRPGPVKTPGSRTTRDPAGPATLTRAP